MPSELDPAFDAFLARRETPAQSMKRIERELRGPEGFEYQGGPNLNPALATAGAGRNVEGYSANVGMRGGPLSAGLIGAGDQQTGRPTMVGGRVQAGPVSYQYTQPTFPGARPSHQVGVGGMPFDADTYFGGSVQQGPGGRTYGASVGQHDDQGGWDVYGGFNPTSRGVNVGGEYRANFASGGRAVVGHTSAAGVPVSLEEHKGEMRHRAHSGDSRMAADYGYIDSSRPDHDGMKTDAFVGPHHDSRKVFVINQQHPHTKRFNEHKVMLGYKDRAHALHDYAHSFSDGLGHKRIHSVVEMDAHQLKDWLKKRHAQPLRKADGGPVTPRMLASRVVAPEEQSAIDGKQAGSPSLEGIGQGMQVVGEGFEPLGEMAADYVRSRYQDPSKLGGDVMAAGRAIKHAVTEDPLGTAAGLNPVVGTGQGLASISDIKDAALKARAEGDESTYRKLAAAAAAMAVGIAIPGMQGVGGDLAKSAERSALSKFAGKAGTSSDEMAALLDRVRGTKLGELVDRYQHLSPEEAHAKLYGDLANLAREGEPGRLWYEKSSKRILDYTQGDKDAADKLAQLIAIYSPQTTVDVNTANAMKAYNRALTGEQLWNGEILNRDVSFKTIKEANDYVRSLGGSDAGVTKVPLDDSGKRFLIAKHGGDYDNIATADRDLKAHLVMNENIPFEGRKTNNFYNNLMVHVDPTRLQGSTQDLWMARAFGFLDDAVGNTGKYDYMERVTADLAKELGWEPHQVQAAIWTAMKTRQEGVSDAVKREAIEKGLATMVPNPKGKEGSMMFQVKDGAENQYAQLMREHAMGAEVTPETIRSSARDFSDFLDHNLAHISWETAPSNKIAHLQGFDDLPPQAKAEYHMEMSKALQDEDGRDLISKYLGVLSPGKVEAPGYWEGRSNPATMTQLGTTRVKAAGKTPTMDTSSRDLADLDAAIRGLVLKQDGVGYHRPYYDPQVSKANGMEYTFDKPLSADDVVSLGKDLDNRFGGSVGLMPVGPNKVRIVDFGWDGGEGLGEIRQIQQGGKGGKKSYVAAGPLPKGTQEVASFPNAKILYNEKGKPRLEKYTDSRDFHKAVDDVINNGSIDGNAEYRVFASDGNLVGNDWRTRPNGEDYIQRIGAAGRPDVLEYISTVLAPRVQAVDERFAARHGLPRDTAIEDALRKLHHVAPAAKASGGVVRRYAEGGQVGAAPQSFDLAPKVSDTAKDVAMLAKKGDIDQRKLAYLLKAASTGTMPPGPAFEFAREILTGNTQSLIQRFNTYPRSIRVLARVDLALGGLGGQSLGTLANQKVRDDPASPTGRKMASYAKGGKVKKAEKKPHTGGRQAFEQFAMFARQNYPAQIASNMMKRSNNDAAKLMFALNQYTKNLVAQDPQHADLHKAQLAQLNQIARANNINPRAAFNRTPDAMDMRKELQSILKSDHKINPAFKAALQRMDKLVGSK